MVRNVVNGQFERIATPGLAITTFSLTDVVSGQIRFVHAGGNAAPAFEVAASDSVSTTAFTAATIVFTPPVVNNPPPLQDNPPPSSSPSRRDPPPASGSSPTTANAQPIEQILGVSRGEAVAPAMLILQVPQVPTAERNAQSKTNAPNPVKAVPVLALGPTTMQMQPISLPPTIAPTLPTKIEPAKEVIEEVVPAVGQILDGPEQKIEGITLSLDSTKAMGIALSVGIVSWVLRAAGLLSSLLASLPAWNHVDPLPVLAKNKNDEDEEENETTADEEERDWRSDTSAFDDRALARILEKE
jgi:hypothetical protein